ncbi:MAG: HWE histidine kinase domain-containing protein [Brevundimonas sp.]|uniref:sensor histidine kinase n=1 Tax=Brevundimonas sp. TaxID=1871086 RepID=UPI002734CFDC|nr:HWE histidine kinase domain-containing protein [Brevundimonas sp.]MDP3404223.1 HWE histidine kinase domain-containing protein [Brevundimonas sp.]
MKALDQAIDLAAAFEASPNPYMLLTPDLRYAGMNAAYLTAVGMTRDQLVGRGIFEVFDAGPGDDAAENSRQLRRSFEKVLATGEQDHLALIHYALPVTGADGVVVHEDRYWSATHTPLRDASGTLVLILQHTTDITELENLRRERAAGPESSALDLILGGNVIHRARAVQEDNRRLELERNRLVEMFMQAPGFVAILSGPDHVFEMHNSAYGQLLGHRDLLGKAAREALPEVVGQGFFELLDTVFATGEPFEGRNSRIELQRRPSGPPEVAWLDFIYQPVRDDDGKVVGIFVQGHEVTQTVLAGERQKLMIDELNHRVKNTLATVQSIAMQTARSHPDPRTFADSFQQRLLALSHTHDLLTRSHWEGADLRDVLEHETSAHGPSRIVLNGPPVALDPASALSFGMIFHELATNAAKYGALSSPEGRVLVDWSVANQTRRTLSVTWRETGGQTVVPPDRRGFGSRMIERNVRHDLAGEVKLGYPGDGFIAELSVPLDRDAQHDG